MRGSEHGRRWHRLPRRGDDRGAAAVEFAGTLPVILITFALLWQAALIGYTFSLAGNAADKGARAGAAGGDDAACAAAILEDLPGAWTAEPDCGASGDLYRARVTLSVPLLLPGAADLPFEFTGEAAAPYEKPGEWP
ncbi:TadE/TadG family type IV pilus assembly protein [Streptomyces sp. NPDC000594]|uniref:TadE/TadG family type IV pilus assembly protein n=1 Tax=Streptomyces sp. NPDC000594 TaxID=3154261 RepID=UPI00332E884E